MKEVIFEITQWPEGQSLDVALENGGSISIAGVHGGGIGYTVKRFEVNVGLLKKVIAELCGEEEE